MSTYLELRAGFFMDTTAKEKIIRPDFFQVPTVILDDPDMNTLDGFVYAVIYWYAKLKLEKCIASNATIAVLVRSKKQSVANSISKLARKKYIRVIMNSRTHQREELIPLITFSHPYSTEYPPYSTEESPLLSKVTPPYSVEEQNNNILSKRVIKTVTSKTGLVACTAEELQEIAKDLNVDLTAVKRTHDIILDKISAKEFKGKTVYLSLRNWIRMGMERGTIKELPVIKKNEVIVGGVVYNVVNGEGLE